MQSMTMCPFCPVAIGWIRAGLKEVALVKGKYKETGVHLSTEVCAQVFDILLGDAVQECGVPDAAYNRRRWILI